MIPLISHYEKIDGLTLWVTTDNRVGVGFRIDPIDIEEADADSRVEGLTHFLRHLDPRVLGRIELCSEDSHEFKAGTARDAAIEELGIRKKTIRLFVEVVGEPIIIQKLRWLVRKPERQQALLALVKVYESAQSLGLNPLPLGEGEINHLFNQVHGFVKAPSSIQNGQIHLGIVRMTKQSSSPVTLEKVVSAFESLPVPNEIHVSFRKPDPGKTRFHLERKLKQARSSFMSPQAEVEETAVADTLRASLERGVELMEFEFLVILKRRSEEDLRKALADAATVLLKIGGFAIETFGIGPSFLATLPGNNQHVPLLETDEYLPILLPLFHHGEASLGHALASTGRAPALQASVGHTPAGSLPLLREDRTVHNFDLFNPEFSVANTLIVGTSGKGKSVLTGLLTESLLNDPKVKVIKIDVGGSHTKECELFGGRHISLQLNSPSGLNPLAVASDERLTISERSSIISNFLLTLITEQGETILTKDLRSSVESEVGSYIEKAKIHSLQEFFDLQKTFPRRNLLARWVKGGMYESTFEKASEAFKPSRLTYYDFKECFQASDPEFSQAGFAALLAQFNHECLVNKDERIVLICDEVPFFIKSCFQSLKFATANVRKFGHAIVQIAQLSTDFIVGGDTGLLENSPQRFLFSTDGDHSDFQARFRLTDANMVRLTSLQSIPGKYSEVLLQDQKAARKLRIEITREEFWRLTSSKHDAIKLEKLRAAVPELTLKETIKCLSAI